MDYLRLFNALARHVKPERSAYREATRLDAPLVDTGLDSLDITLLSVYVCEIYDIPEAIGKTMVVKTFADMVKFVETHRRREPASADEALAAVIG